MPSYTTNLNLTKPTVGGDTNVWGGYVNGNSDTLDGIFADAGNGTSVGLNVGSGKTLTVAGTLTSSGSASFSNIDVNGGAIDATPIGANSTSTGAFTQVSADTAFFDTNTLVVSSASKVGIGVTTPNYLLDISSSSNGDIVNVYTTGTEALVRADTSASNPVSFGADNTGDFIIKTGSTPTKRFSIGDTGTGSVTLHTGSLFLDTASAGIYLKSPNGTEFKITVDNSGNLVATEQ